jgi:hypothetical protein
MQKGRVGREEGEEAKMSLRGGREAVLTIGLPGNATTRHDSSARTHAGGRWHQGRASPLAKVALVTSPVSGGGTVLGTPCRHLRCLRTQVWPAKI